MKTVLIAGGSGLIGSHLSEMLVAQGYEVRWLSRKTDADNKYVTFGWNPDNHTVVESVKKTNRLVVVDESWPMFGVSAEVAYEIQKFAFDYLDAPILRVNSADVSLPYAAALVEAYLPNPAKIIAAVKSVMYTKVKAV